jgi:acyl-CoA synthetase (AMP-forming)/AMP-acid ligase II
MNFGSVCRYWANRQPDKVAMRYDGQEVTWRHLDLATDEVAAGLADLGVLPDGSVAVLAPPSGECAQMMIAVLKLGVPVLVFEPDVPAGEVGAALARRACPVVVTDGRQASFLQQIRHRSPDIIEVRLGSPFDHRGHDASLKAADEVSRIHVPLAADAIVIHRASSDGLRTVSLSHKDLLMLASRPLSQPADTCSGMVRTSEVWLSGIC